MHFFTVVRVVRREISLAFHLSRLPARKWLTATERGLIAVRNVLAGKRHLCGVA